MFRGRGGRGLRADGLEAKLDRIIDALNRCNERIDGLTARLGGIEAKMEKGFEDLGSLIRDPYQERDPRPLNLTPSY